MSKDSEVVLWPLHANAHTFIPHMYACSIITATTTTTTTINGQLIGFGLWVVTEVTSDGCRAPSLSQQQ